MNKHRLLSVQRAKERRLQGSQRPKPQQKRDPNLVPLEEVKERVLLELSAAFAQQLKAQRTDLTGLSFFCEESAKPRRIELSKLINRLKGKWKIADNAKATNFIIVDQDILKGRKDKIPRYFQDTCQAIHNQAEEYIAAGSSQHLKPQSMAGLIQENQAHKLHSSSQAPALRRAFPANLGRQEPPLSKAQLGHQSLSAQKSVHIDVLRSWLPHFNNINLYGRQILASDLTSALRFLESQTAAFHTSRMKTVLLERDQIKPTAFTDDGAFFVVSKLNFGGVDDTRLGSLQKQQQFIDFSTRQVFHEYEKLTNAPMGSSPTPEQSGSRHQGVSPAKARSLQQTAIAQQKFEDEKNPKASPAGHLNRQLINDPKAVAFKTKLRPRYNLHKTEFNTPNGYCPCISKTEKAFAMQNFNLIERQRARENYKNLMRATETDNDVQPWHNAELLEPIPNEQHTYCQVCMESYDDYLDHIQNSATHKKRAKIQDGPFAEIDQINDDLNRKQKWIHNWKPEPICEYPGISMTGVSQFSNLNSNNGQVDPVSVSQLGYLANGVAGSGFQAAGGASSSKDKQRRRQSFKPPTPFKLKTQQQVQQQNLTKENPLMVNVSQSSQIAESIETSRQQNQQQILTTPQQPTAMIDTDEKPEASPVANWPSTPQQLSTQKVVPECRQQDKHSSPKLIAQPVIDKEVVQEVLPVPQVTLTSPGDHVIALEKAEVEDNQEALQAKYIPEVQEHLIELTGPVASFSKQLFQTQPQPSQSNVLIMSESQHSSSSEARSQDNDEFDSSSDDSSDSAADIVRKQIRDSIHKTHLHSVNKPLFEQTYYRELEQRLDQQQEVVPENEQESSEEQAVAEGQGLSSDSDYDESDEEDGDGSDYSQDEMVALGNTIARIDRRQRGEPTPDKDEDQELSVKESKPIPDDAPMQATSQIQTRNQKVVQAKTIVPKTCEDNFNYHTPNQKQNSPVNKVLDFNQSDEDDESEEDRLRQIKLVRSSLERSLATSPQVPSLEEPVDAATNDLPMSHAVSGKEPEAFIKLFPPPPKPPQTSPDSIFDQGATNIIKPEHQAKYSFVDNAYKPLVHAFNQIKATTQPAGQAANCDHTSMLDIQQQEHDGPEEPGELNVTDQNLEQSYTEPEFTYEQLQEALNMSAEEEDTYPNVFTEEVTNDKRFIEEHQITVDLTPCSHHDNFYDGSVDLPVTVGNHHHNHQPEGLKNDRMAKGFSNLVTQAKNNNFNDCLSSTGKKSVPSLLTSNDKYSCADRRSSRKSSQSSISSVKDTGRFGTDGTAQIHNLTIKSFPGVTSNRDDESGVMHEGTLGNVSFGQAANASNQSLSLAIIQEAAASAKIENSYTNNQDHQVDIEQLFMDQNCPKGQLNHALAIKKERTSAGIADSGVELQQQVPMKLKLERSVATETADRTTNHQNSSEKADSILIVDKVKRNQALFASQAQLPSQQTFDVGEFSSSQNLHQNGTGQFSSFKTQNSAQGFHNPLMPSSHQLSSTRMNSQRYHGGISTLNISQTVNIHMAGGSASFTAGHQQQQAQQQSSQQSAAQSQRQQAAQMMMTMAANQSSDQRFQSNSMGFGSKSTQSTTQRNLQQPQRQQQQQLLTSQKQYKQRKVIRGRFTTNTQRVSTFGKTSASSQGRDNHNSTPNQNQQPAASNQFANSLQLRKAKLLQQQRQPQSIATTTPQQDQQLQQVVHHPRINNLQKKRRYAEAFPPAVVTQSQEKAENGTFAGVKNIDGEMSLSRKPLRKRMKVSEHNTKLGGNLTAQVLDHPSAEMLFSGPSQSRSHR